MPGIVDAVDAKMKEVGIESYDDGTQGNEEQTITIDENPKPELQDLNAYYDCDRKNFLITNSRGDWIPATEAHVKRELRKLGYCSRVQSGENLSQVESKLSEIQLNRDIKFSGAVAGYRVGLIEDEFGRILVTSGPKIIDPKHGNWETVREFMSSLFGDQLDYVLSWIQIAYKALSSGHIMPCWALAISGKKGNGKSFFQERILTPILGGRVGLPYRYMTGGSQFNSDLIGAEHMMIADEFPSTDIRSRKQFGERIKAFVANETQSWHGKNKDQYTVKPFWRVSITLNDESEDLQMLPPLGDGLQDKLTVLKSSKATNLPQQHERASFLEKVTSELPAFIDYLMHDYVIPEELRDDRFGVKSFQHPEILEAMGEQSPEYRLNEYITEVFFGIDQPYQDDWTGKTIEIERKLRESTYCKEVDRMFYWPAACGTYLGKLAKNGETGKRYKKLAKRDGYTYWKIYRNPVEKVDQTTGPF
jgi:hypothetical protein